MGNLRCFQFKLSRWVWSAVTSLGLAASSAHAVVIYVDDDAPPGGDGLTWNTAYTFLHDALAFANHWQNDVTEMRIAQGTYKPDRTASHPEGSGDTSAYFDGGFNGMMLGGFAGVGAADPDERNIDAYPTIFSGDLNGDDQPRFINFEDNSLTIMKVGNGCHPDGCTFTNAGVGIYSPFYIPISNCRLVSNKTAMLCPDAHIIASFCVVSGNVTGISANGYRAEADHCQFANNTGRVFSGYEQTFQATNCQFINNTDGVCFASESLASFRDCEFVGNSAERGGVVAIGGFDALGAAAYFDNCTFKDNSAQRGGVIYSNSDGDYAYFQCINCVFFNNSATDKGGAIYSHYSTGTLINCTFARNSAPIAGAVFNANLSTLRIFNSIIKGNPGGSFGGNGARTVRYSNIGGGHAGVGNIDVDSKFRNIALGNLKLKAGSKCIDAGRKSYLPSDILTDLAGKPRLVDAPDTPNTGVGSPPIDMGAYEFQRN